MLSERGLAIVEKLIENNNMPITSKALATELGISERSVKTYIREVSEYFQNNNIEFIRQPGKGFTARFSDDQILELNRLLGKKKMQMSKRQRINYIAHTLLSGWGTYTLSLFSEELCVSKNVISEDISSVGRALSHFDIKINRLAGHGITAEGSEFAMRKALIHCSEFPLGNIDVTKQYDHRLTIDESSLYINNFGKENYEKVIEILHLTEKNCHIIYTDYSFEMLSRYLTVQLTRLKFGKFIKDTILEEDIEYDAKAAMIIISQIERISGQKLTLGERQYVGLLLACSAVQNPTEANMPLRICELGTEMVSFLSELLNAELVTNELLISSVNVFLKSSLIRTRYGIEIRNPFLKDIAEMYSGIFAACFMTGRFYEKETGHIPSDHEIAFIALLVGGALHRIPRSIKAILIGTGALLTANITAINIETRIPDIEIIAVLSSEKLEKIDDYECDIVLSTLNYGGDNEKIVSISPIISARDEKIIRDKCYKIKSDNSVEKSIFNNLIDEKHIYFLNNTINKEHIIKDICNQLIREEYVQEEYVKDVLYRENIEATAIGNGIAIPHGKPEHVIQPKISVVRLRSPIDWGEGRKVDTIFLLALQFDNIASTKAFFYDFTRILSTQENLDRIKSAEDAKSLEIIIKNELHWS